MATFLRAAIMLGVLVGLPAAWMYYGPLPEGAQRVVDRFVAAAKDALDWDARFGENDAARTTAAPRIADLEIGTPGAGTPRLAPEAEVATQASLAARVEPLLARLRELGAAEYALEPWGAGGQMYRFRCEMPLGTSEQAVEQFEAMGADPQATIERVAADIAAWRTQRLAMR